MQGLNQLYRHTGRTTEWSRLVEEIVPDFIDPTNEGPLPGKEEDYGIANMRQGFWRSRRRLGRRVRKMPSAHWRPRYTGFRKSNGNRGRQSAWMATLRLSPRSEERRV